MEYTILIVEDDIEIIDLLTIHMKDLNANVHVADNGRLGLKKAMEFDYDLILLDLSIPELSGIEVCKEQVRRSRRPADRHVGDRPRMVLEPCSCKSRECLHAAHQSNHALVGLKAKRLCGQARYKLRV